MWKTCLAIDQQTYKQYEDLVCHFSQQFWLVFSTPQDDKDRKEECKWKPK